jgi:hypothetical protein
MEHVKRFIIDGKYVNYWKHGTPPYMEIKFKMHMCIQMFIKLAIPQKQIDNEK